MYFDIIGVEKLVLRNLGLHQYECMIAGMSNFILPREFRVNIYLDKLFCLLKKE